MSLVTRTINYLFISLFVISLLCYSTSTVNAQQYGQGGVVLGDSKGEVVHSSVDAGIAENLSIVGLFFLLLSVSSFYTYKKMSK